MLVANKLAGLLEEDQSPEVGWQDHKAESVESKGAEAEVQAGALHGLRALGPNFAGPHAQVGRLVSLTMSWV